MNLADILNLLDEISNSLVFSEDGETAHLEQLPEKFGDVAAIVRELGREEEAGYCHQAITLAARLVSGEVDWTAGMDVLGRTLNALQACLSDECPVAEALARWRATTCSATAATAFRIRLLVFDQSEPPIRDRRGVSPPVYFLTAASWSVGT